MSCAEAFRTHAAQTKVRVAEDSFTGEESETLCGYDAFALQYRGGLFSCFSGDGDMTVSQPAASGNYSHILQSVLLCAMTGADAVHCLISLRPL